MAQAFEAEPEVEVEVESFARANILRRATGTGAPECRYEQNVEQFFRHAPPWSGPSTVGRGPASLVPVSPNAFCYPRRMANAPVAVARKAGAGLSLSEDRTTPNPAASTHRLLTFAWAFAAVGLAVVSWSLATPLMAAPDEPSHIVQAAAIVRGQFDVPSHPGPVGPLESVRVPEWVQEATFHLPPFAFHANVPAGPSNRVGDSTKLVNASTQFSNYPPLYYLIDGVPTLFMTGEPALYAMRLLSSLLNIGLITVGLFLLARYQRGRFPLFGALVALTPMVWFLCSVVSDSGLEIASAFAAWCGGLCIIDQRRVPRALAVWTALSFVILILSRPASPYEAAVMVAVLALFAGARRVRELLHDRILVTLGIPMFVAATVAVVLYLIGGPPRLFGHPLRPSLGLGKSMSLTWHQTGIRLRQAIGKFGWLDTNVPLIVVVIWTTVFGALCAIGLFLSSRSRRAWPVLALAIVATPLLFESPRIDKLGPFWQGRYWLPLAVGLPLLASALPLRTPHRRALPRVAPFIGLLGLTTVGAVLCWAQTVSFMTALHRYQTGVGAVPGTPVHWTPPGGTVLVVTMFLSSQVLLLGFICWNSIAGKSGHSPVLPTG